MRCTHSSSAKSDISDRMTKSKTKLQPPKEEKHPAWFNQLMLRFNDIEYLQGGIPKLMENLNYNQIYINRIFKKTMGMSIGTHLNETRLQFALTYLKTSNLSINDISEILGFSSPSFFPHP